MSATADRIRAAGAVAILRLESHEHCLDVGRAVMAGGLEVMEVTLGRPGAAEALGALAEAVGRAALIGAGTVLTVAQVDLAARAGARFCVSPHVDPEVIRATLDAGLEPLPGAFTATEVLRAVDAGARLVKLFPAGPAGVGYLRALRGPLPSVGLVPTGGIRHDDVADWLAAGAVAVGLGSDLVGPRPTAADLPGITERARRVVAQAAGARAS